VSVAALVACAIGAGVTAWGVRTAASARRPLDLAGALAAPGGLALALLGALAALVPGFLG
jgi:hypothetical protein